MSLGRLHPLGIALVASLALVGSTAAAQQAPSKASLETLAGKYKGTAMSPDGEMLVSADLKFEAGKLSGSIASDAGSVLVLSGALEGDKLTLTCDMNGMPMTMVGTVAGDKITGTWAIQEVSGAFSIARDTAAAPATAEAPGAASPAAADPNDPITGEWEGTVDVPDQPQPITLTLKLEGETVTGQLGSSMGAMPLEGGKWARETSTVTANFNFNGMVVAMSGTLKDGKLAGIMDVGGQGQIGWAAARAAKR